MLSRDQFVAQKPFQRINCLKIIPPCRPDLYALNLFLSLKKNAKVITTGSSGALLITRPFFGEVHLWSPNVVRNLATKEY